MTTNPSPNVFDRGLRLSRPGKHIRFPIAVAVLATLASVSMVGCGESSDNDPAVAIVEGAGTGPANVTGTDVWVQLPSGRIAMTIGDPVDTIPASETHAEPIKASGDDERFLPIDIKTEPRVGVPAGVWPSTATDVVEPELALIIGGKRYMLNTDEDRDGNPDSISGAHYVSVEWPTEAPDVVLSVNYAGVEQTVSTTGERETGEAEELYGMPPVGETPCSDGWRAGPKDIDPKVEVSCSYSAFYYPYLPEKGWAARQHAGQTWVVLWVSATLESARLAKPAGTCVLGKGTGTVTLDGSKPEVTRQLGGPNTAVNQWAAFSAAQTNGHGMQLTRSQACRIGSVGYAVRLESDTEISPTHAAGSE